MLTIAGAALIAANPGSTVLVVVGILCIVGALWAFGAWGALWGLLSRTKQSPVVAAASPASSIMGSAGATQPVFPPAPAAAAGNAEQHIETRREAARATGAQSEHQRDQDAGTLPSDRGSRVGRREAQGRELLMRLAELRVRATTLSFSIEPAMEFNDLLAEAERWVGSSRNVPHAVSTTPTGLSLPSDWFTDGDFARLKAYLEEHMRRLQK